VHVVGFTIEIIIYTLGDKILIFVRKIVFVATSLGPAVEATLPHSKGHHNCSPWLQSGMVLVPVTQNCRLLRLKTLGEKKTKYSFEVITIEIFPMQQFWNMRTKLFCVLTQRVAVIASRRSGTTYRSLPQGSRIQKERSSLLRRG
jgi:hypothetical protein